MIDVCPAPSVEERLPDELDTKAMPRFLKALFRFLGRFFKRFRFYNFPLSGAYSGFRIPPKAGAEELSKELDLDLTEAGEPRVSLPDAEISEKEREEAVRRYQRELKEKGRR
jgi:hypothetical protein